MPGCDEIEFVEGFKRDHVAAFPVPVAVAVAFHVPALVLVEILVSYRMGWVLYVGSLFS